MSSEEEDANVLKAFSEMSAISDELKSLEAKDDPVSLERCLELEDALMTIDMGLRPFKMKMGRSKEPQSQ